MWKPGLALLLVLVSGPGARAKEEPFEIRTLHVPGRPLEVFTVPVEGGPPRVVVASVEGTVPEERRHLAVFDLRRRGDELEGSLELPPDVVGIDAADLDAAPGAELALLSARGLRVHRAGGPRPLLERVLEPPLPLPPPTRGISRVRFLGRWSGDGSISALVPALDGVRHVSLSGTSRALRVALEADYLVLDPSVGLQSGIEAQTTWPDLALGDDDGDGRPDLFTLSRYRVDVFRNGPDGLPAAPTRSIPLRAFSAEEERRHLATSLATRVHDLDGDGLADLILHRTIGTLLKSDATATVFRNHGEGADPSATPDAVISGEGGFGSIFVDDFDGDGRAEVLQIIVPFGVLQVVRVLVTTKAQAVFRLFAFGPDLAGPTKSWQDEFTLPLDFDAGRVAGVLPTVRGDWNGDGLRDLLYGPSSDHIAIRPGERGPDGPRFGSVNATQKAPSADRSAVADLDGDGLDDLLLWDTEDESGEVHVLRNRGTLPGAPPSLRAPAAEARNAP